MKSNQNPAIHDGHRKAFNKHQQSSIHLDMLSLASFILNEVLVYLYILSVWFFKTLSILIM